MLLSEVLDRYALYRPIEANSRYQYGRTLGVFGEYLTRDGTTDDLTGDVVSAWVLWMADRWATCSRMGHRNKLLVLWRFAHKRGWAAPVGEIRVVRKPDPMPTSWILAEVRKLVDATGSPLLGKFKGRRVGPYFKALIMTGYESGLRRGDLWALERDNIGADGFVQITMHKTGWGHRPQLSLATTALVLALPGPRPLAWWGVEHRSFYRQWDKLVAIAGVRNGALHQLRRTGASYIARDQGIEAAKRWLGHRDEGMFKHYVDQTVCRPRAYQPPSIVD